jgi:hypothetical protein
MTHTLNILLLKRHNTKPVMWKPPVATLLQKTAEWFEKKKTHPHN